MPTHKQSRKNPESPKAEIPPGATRKALDRPLDPGGGGPGIAAGPRHAANDIASESETVGITDTLKTPASPPTEDEDDLEKGPPYASRSGSAVGGTPAQGRSSVRSPRRAPAVVEGMASAKASKPTEQARIAPATGGRNLLRLTGFEAIE